MHVMKFRKSFKSCVGGDAYIAPLGSYEFAKDFRVLELHFAGGSRVCPYEAYWKSGLPDHRESARFLFFAVPLTSLQVDPAVRQKRHALGL